MLGISKAIEKYMKYYNSSKNNNCVFPSPDIKRTSDYYEKVIGAYYVFIVHLNRLNCGNRTITMHIAD